MDPPPSLAVASGTIPAATAAAEPPLEPPGVRQRSHGLRAGGPNLGLRVRRDAELRRGGVTEQHQPGPSESPHDSRRRARGGGRQKIDCRRPAERRQWPRPNPSPRTERLRNGRRAAPPDVSALVSSAGRFAPSIVVARADDGAQARVQACRARQRQLEQLARPSPRAGGPAPPTRPRRAPRTRRPSAANGGHPFTHRICLSSATTSTRSLSAAQSRRRCPCRRRASSSSTPASLRHSTPAVWAAQIGDGEPLARLGPAHAPAGPVRGRAERRFVALPAHDVRPRPHRPRDDAQVARAGPDGSLCA